MRDVGKIPVRYIKLPRQGHSIKELRLQRIALVEEIRWFKKYVEGEEWQPGKRKILCKHAKEGNYGNKDI